MYYLGLCRCHFICQPKMGQIWALVRGPFVDGGDDEISQVGINYLFG